MTECRSWKPSGRGPMTASVRLSLAGARRTTGVSRPDPGALREPGHGAVARLARVRAPIGAERLAEREPLPDRERLRPPIGVDAGRRQRRASTRPASTGSCRARTLWIILRRSRNAGLDEPPELVLLVAASRRSSGGERLDDDDRRLDRRLRLERRRRDRERDPDAGVVLDEHGQVAHRAGRGGDPLGDLALDHEHEPVRPRRLARAADAGSGS